MPHGSRVQVVCSVRGLRAFVEVVLELDSERWAGTEFVPRAGKALGDKAQGAFVRFRSPSGRPADALWIGIEGPDDIRPRLARRAAGRHRSPRRST